ncbi:VG15 protein, partial [Nocardia gipuzkoensis]
DPGPEGAETGTAKRRTARPRNKVVGWARVATSAEPCGFCQMMVSRGPIYRSARTAGFHGSNALALQLFGDGQDKRMQLAMTKWHPGCRCKVVPVFDLRNWPGRDEYLAAKRLWKTSTKGLSGQEAVNAFRRVVEADYERLKKPTKRAVPEAA